MGKKQSKYLREVETYDAHDDSINYVTILPSGNIISVSTDKSIKIWDININLLQNIQNAHNDKINYVDKKDEKNFVTCSNDKNIKTQIKNKNEYELNQIIEKAHNKEITKIQYLQNGNLISSSLDNKIKIWNLIKKNNKYQLMSIINHRYSIISFLILEDKNLLISAKSYLIKFWNLNFYNFIWELSEMHCENCNGIERLDENRILIGGGIHYVKIISIKERKIIKSLYLDFDCIGIFVLRNKNLFIVINWPMVIKLYRNDNYELYQYFQLCSDRNSINGFTVLNNGLVLSYGFRKLKIWNFLKDKT